MIRRVSLAAALSLIASATAASAQVNFQKIGYHVAMGDSVADAAGTFSTGRCLRCFARSPPSGRPWISSVALHAGDERTAHGVSERNRSLTTKNAMTP